MYLPLPRKLGGGTREITEADLTENRKDVSVPIKFSVGAAFNVRLPSAIELTKSDSGWGYTGAVGVKGDITSGSEVMVTPDSSITMYDVTNRPTDDVPADADDQSYSHKDAKSVAVAQTKNSWKQTEINADTYTDTDLNLTTGAMKSGKWKGTLNVNIMEGNHEFVEDMSKHKDATCTANGSKTLTCNTCGETRTETIAATGHNYVQTVTKEATCYEFGEATETCSVCENSKDKVYISPVHNYVDHYCTSCGAQEPGIYDADGNLLTGWTTYTDEYGNEINTLESESGYLNMSISPSGCYGSELPTGYALSGNLTCGDDQTVVLPPNVISLGEYMSSLDVTCDTLVIQSGYLNFQGHPGFNCKKLVGEPDILDSEDDWNFGWYNAKNPFINPDLFGADSLPNGEWVAANGKVLLARNQDAGDAIQSGIEVIADGAFRQDQNRTTITIPNTVKYLVYEPFDGCDKLTEITYEGTQEQWNAINKDDGDYGWTYGSAITTIHCTDGDITL